jgi:hypothetical protein
MLKHAMAGMVAAIALGSPGFAHADYGAGLKAFNARQYPAAAKEWETAARAGDAKSAFRLGKLYQNGNGVAQDNAKAYVWFKVAEAAGNVDAGIAAHFVGQKLAAAKRTEVATRAKAYKGGGGDGSGPFGNLAGMELRRTFQDDEFTRSEIWRFGPNGVITAVASKIAGGSVARREQDADSGRWAIEGGKLCVTWKKWNDGQKVCYTAVKQGKTYKFTGSNGRSTVAYIAKQ